MGRSSQVYWIMGFALAMLGFDTYCLNLFAAQNASKHYHAVTGLVLRSRMEKMGQAGVILPGAPQQFVFRYVYRCNNRTYTNSTYRYLEDISPQSAFMQMPEGKAVDVFFSPANPRDAVLSSGLKEADWGKMLQLFCLNTMMFSLLMLWARWQTRLIFPATRIWQG